MLKFRSILLGHLTKPHTCRSLQQPYRYISALYVTGDKANENTAPIQPYLDFEGTFQNKELVNDSIKKRKLKINLDRIIDKYKVFKDYQSRIADIEKQRHEVAEQLKALYKESNKDENSIEKLKQTGKNLRSDLKNLKQTFYPIDDEFVHEFLDIPNLLHKQCPTNEHERVIYVSPAKRIEDGKSHMENKRLIEFLNNETYYMLEEAAIFDLEATHAFSDYIVINGDFIQTCNPDFAHRVLLQANGTPLETYHKVVDRDAPNKINPAYLVGGGSFESYLGDNAKMVVQPNVLPLRYAGYGRNYRRKSLSRILSTPSLYTATQSNAVHTFVATATPEEADEEMEKILSLAVDFYKELGVHFRVVYVDASRLNISESLRAQIEIYSPAEKRYISVGHVSNYGNFVSKRILFTMQENKDYKFLHLIGGPVMYTTRLIAALIENGIALDKCNLLGHSDVEYDFDAIDKIVDNRDHAKEFEKRGIDLLHNAFK